MKTPLMVCLLVATSFSVSGQTPNKLAKFDAGGTPTNSTITEVNGNVGINDSSPAVPLQIKVRYPINTTSSEELIRFITPNGHDPFQFYQRTTLFGNDQTNSVGWGFSPAGSPQGAPSLSWIMEDTFGGGTDPNEAQFEMHVQAATPLGGGDRPLTMNVNRLTGRTRWTWSAAEQHFYAGQLAQTGVNEFHVAEAGIMTIGRTAPIRNIGITKFETLDNGGADNTQISIRPFPTNSATSWLLFGNTGGGVSLAKFGQGFAFFRGGSALSAGESHAYRFYAYGPQYGGQPLLAVSDGFKLAAGRAIYFSSSANPEGASDLHLTRSGVGALLISNPTTGARAVLDASFNANTFGGGGYKTNGVPGVTVSGSSCKITQISAGIITAATCTP